MRIWKKISSVYLLPSLTSSHLSSCSVIYWQLNQPSELFPMLITVHLVLRCFISWHDGNGNNNQHSAADWQHLFAVGILCNTFSFHTFRFCTLAGCLNDLPAWALSSCSLVLELDVSCITPTIWSGEITTFRQIHSVHWQHNSYCGTMCCQSVTVASCSGCGGGRIECPGLSEMIHNAIGYDALTENKILCYQYHNIKSQHRT